MGEIFNIENQINQDPFLEGSKEIDKNIRKELRKRFMPELFYKQFLIFLRQIIFIDISKQKKRVVKLVSAF